jgi:cell division protein FtsQ
LSGIVRGLGIHRLLAHRSWDLIPRRVLLIALIATAVLAGGWLWLRNSPLVAVEHVRVSGVSGPDAIEVEAALSKEARQMSTLNLNVGALREAVARFHLVAGLHASTSFPHGLDISVSEQLPVAALVADGLRTAVAADGVVLGPALASKALPVLRTSSEPLVGRHISGAQLTGSLAVLSAAPAPLARLIARVYTGPEGLTVAMHNGLLVYFGDSSRLHAKWASLAAVLGAPSSLGASYVDVRLPERPAAGVAGGPQSSADVSASDPTAAALAATLAEAVSGAPAATPASPSTLQSPSTSESSSSGASATASTPSTEAEAQGTSTTTETSTSVSGEAATPPAPTGG